jgi:hypothetical protein
MTKLLPQSTANVLLAELRDRVEGAFAEFERRVAQRVRADMGPVELRDVLVHEMREALSHAGRVEADIAARAAVAAIDDASNSTRVH